MAALLLGSFGLTGCGEDDPVTPRDFGFSKVTFLHANPGRKDSKVAFFWGDTVAVSSSRPSYLGTLNATVPNGENLKYSVKALDGTTLALATGAHDSAQHAMVVYTGNALTDDLFVAATKKISSSSSGKAAVRFVHAAKDAGPRALKIGTPEGATIAANVSYQRASGAFISIDAATDTLWIVDNSDGKDPIPVPVNLSLANVWTIVFHGVENPADPVVDADLKWRGTPVAEVE